MCHNTKKNTIVTDQNTIHLYALININGVITKPYSTFHLILIQAILLIYVQALITQNYIVQIQSILEEMVRLRCLERLKMFSSDSAGKLHVLRHYCYTFCMDCAQIGVFEETNEISFGSFLEGENSLSLEP